MAPPVFSSPDVATHDTTDVLIQSSGTRCIKESYQDAYEIFGNHFEADINYLLQNSVASNTFKTYLGGLESFCNFRVNFGLNQKWPAPLQDVIFFITHLFKTGLSHSTINCYLSGISFFHKLNNLLDNTQCFVVRKMVEDVRRAKSKLNSRLPLTRELLEKIVSVVPSLCSSQFETKLFTAAFSLAFHGLFRVGELTVGSKGIADHTVLFNNVKVCDEFLPVYLATSKTDQLGTGKVLTISSQYNVKICPVIALSSYYMVRPSVEGPLFCHYDTKPLTRYQFSAVLKKSLAVLGYKGSNYKSRSFRIGMDTTLSIEGYADDYVKILVRWKSDSSYLKYIRVPV
ncbi:unnamed protein product [Mytilus coruscus]|uniref:Integrase SAM-like N-terminal domain-containing protein n=1 Tax=Mytilus coruscus TaxID=42192 RepID=A0A6J8DKJ4_MYTCO|nr:unnamed protein product [Mytilus coruscus]